MIVLEVLSSHGLKVMIFDYSRMSYYGRIFPHSNQGRKAEEESIGLKQNSVSDLLSRSLLSSASLLQAR